MRSLVVDDDQVCRMVLQGALERFGAVDVVPDGISALASVAALLATGGRYDFVCLDIMMPELDGQQTLAAIRGLEERFPKVPGRNACIAMTTALADAKNVIKSFRCQADLYFIKPIDIEKVVADIRKQGLVP